MSGAKRGKVMSRAEFARLWADKRLTVAQIGAAIGVSGAAVSGRAVTRGLPGRQMGPLPAIRDDVKFREMWAAQVSIADMALFFGVNPKSIRNHVTRLGLPRRGARGTPITLDDYRAIKLRERMAEAARIEHAALINAEMVDQIGRGLIKRVGVVR